MTRLVRWRGTGLGMLPLPSPIKLKRCRCQAIRVSGLTITKADRQPGHRRESQTHSIRSVARKRTRRPWLERCKTNSWCRRAKTSVCRAARVRKPARRAKNTEKKKVDIARAAYTSLPCKLNWFNENGLFGRHNETIRDTASELRQRKIVTSDGPFSGSCATRACGHPRWTCSTDGEAFLDTAHPCLS